MSAYVVRGGGDHSPSVTRGNGNGKTHRNGATPLQKFVEAKNKINGVFQGIQRYVDEMTAFLKETALHHDFVSPASISDAERYMESVRTIREVLSRDHMKVVFFGRTSNGKSTVINAMLHSKVLPSGMGHTTRCFVQVEGSEGREKQVKTEDDQIKSLESLDQLTHALCSKELGEDALVRVCWPKADSKLLQNEVVLVDSPGIDVSPQFDSWIDKHCLDADVFVLVANAEATLTQTEKNFFHRVSEKLSKPNVFILNNRWDASAAEPEMMDQVRAQHSSRLSRFLVDELQVCGPEEAKHRVFFVSAREILQHRLKDKGGPASPTVYMAEGYQARMLEFQDFERQFEICISQSAIETKFEAHIEKGKFLASSLHQSLTDLSVVVNTAKDNASQGHQEKLSALRSSQTQLLQFITECKDKIAQLSAEVQLKVSTEFTEEIRRLEVVADGFQKPFSDDSNYLPNYKEELADYIDNIVKNELTVRCTGGLLERIISGEREMVAGVAGLLPENFQSKANGIMQYREPFRFSFAIHCRSLLDDFREDLEFRFSLGLPQLIRRFTSMRMASSGSSKERVLGSGNMIPRPLSTPESEYAPSDFRSNCDDALMRSFVYTSASYVANGGVGLLVVGGLVYRTVGWRALATGGALYALCYFYERLSWNNRAKEQTFKRQLRQHLSVKLRHLCHAITMNCDSQVTREVQEVLSRLQAVASDSHQEMKVEVDKLRQDMSNLDKVSKDLAQIKGKAAFINSELDNFAVSHLTKPSNR